MNEPMTLFAVTVSIKIVHSGGFWFSDRIATALSLYFIEAQDRETARAIGVCRALKFRTKESPKAHISMDDSHVREVTGKSDTETQKESAA
jgi:hypothetical protein